MARIDWGRTPEQELATVRTVVQGIVDDLYDNGTPGFIPRVEDFMSEYNGAMKQQATYHQQNTKKLNAIIAIGTVIIAIATVAGIFATVEVSKHSELDPAKVFHSSNPPVVAEFHAQE